MRNYFYKKKEKKKEADMLPTEDDISLLDINVDRLEEFIISMRPLKYLLVFALILYSFIIINFSYKDYIRFQEKEMTTVTLFVDGKEMPVSLQKEKGYINLDGILYVLSNSLYAKMHHQAKDVQMNRFYKVTYVEHEGVRYIKQLEE